MIDARAVATLLAVPLSESAVVERLDELGSDRLAQAFTTWLKELQAEGWLDIASISTHPRTHTVRVELVAPTSGILQFHIRPQEKYVLKLLDMLSAATLGEEVCEVLVAPTHAAFEAVRSTSDMAMDIGPCGVLVLDEAWAAAIAVEQVRPLFYSESRVEESWRPRVRSPAEPPYLGGHSVAELEDLGFGLERSSSRARSVAAALSEDTTTYDEKLRTLKRDTPPPEGTILLATVFLPPVTHCQQAVERFYTHQFGLREESLPLIRERYAWQRRQFEQHIQSFRRVDIIDRHVLQEYLGAPEYYQMPLTVDELRTQIDNVASLLEFDNYTMCLSPEAIDLSFELQGDSLRIRTDRRNKGQPRQGRITSLSFANPSLAEVFEREFWTMYRATEPEFKDRQYVVDWLVAGASSYSGP